MPTCVKKGSEGVEEGIPLCTLCESQGRRTRRAAENMVV